MANATRRSFKGCCAMCAVDKGRVRGQGHGQRITTQDARSRGGRRRAQRQPDLDRLMRQT